MKPPIHMILLDGDTCGKFYSDNERTAGLLILKVAKKEIWEVFPKLNAKVQSRKKLQLNKCRGKRNHQLMQRLADSGK